MNSGWAHLEIMQTIMFSTATRSSHVFRLGQALATPLTNDDDTQSASPSLITSTTASVSTAITTTMGQYAYNEHMAGPSSAIAGPSTTAAQCAAATIIQSATQPMTATTQSTAVSTTTSMDVDNNSVTLLSSRPASSGKRPYSAISATDADVSPPSPSTPTESPISSGSRKGHQKGSHISDPHPLGSRSGASYQGLQFLKTSKVTQAAAMVGMQSQIGRLTDVFERSMTTPQDSAASKLSLALQKLQDVDDGLTTADKTKLIRLFQKDNVSAQVYMDLVIDDLRWSWITEMLDSV